MTKRFLMAFGMMGMLICRPVVCGETESTNSANDLKGPVESGLDWLKRHQNPNGSWSSRNFMLRCSKELGPCKIVDFKNKDGDSYGRGVRGHDIAVTGLVMLTFTGYGNTHLYGADQGHVAVLKRAVSFIRSRFSDINKKTPLLDHAIATMAMAELLVLSGDVEGLKDYVEKAAEYCLATQNRDGGWGNMQGDRTSNTLVTSWMVLALKTTRVCQKLQYVTHPSKEMIGKVYQGALKWFDAVTDKKTGLVRHGKTITDRRNKSTKDLNKDYFVDKVPVWTAMGVLCRIFMGQSRKHELVVKGADQLSKYGPDRMARDAAAVQPVNFMYLYFGAFGMFQHGGQPWLNWSKAMQKTLLQHQRKTADSNEEGCVTGSWDPQAFWSQKGGRVAATSMSVLSLEVCFRYLRALERRK